MSFFLSILKMRTKFSQLFFSRSLYLKSQNGYNVPEISGRSAAWVAHSVRDAGVVGSNPTAPIK